MSLYQPGYLQELTLAGVWIQMAGLKRIWSHSCFSSGAPCGRPSRYFAKERNCSKTALVMCARDDCEKEQRAGWNRNHTEPAPAESIMEIRVTLGSREICYNHCEYVPAKIKVIVLKKQQLCEKSWHSGLNQTKEMVRAVCLHALCWSVVSAPSDRNAFQSEQKLSECVSLKVCLSILRNRQTKSIEQCLCCCKKNPCTFFIKLLVFHFCFYCSLTCAADSLGLITLAKEVSISIWLLNSKK